MQPSNTPPDGDFVRYLEHLTAVQAVPDAQHKRFMFKDAMQGTGALAAIPALPLVKMGWQSVTQIDFRQHLKWGLGLWIVTQIMAWFMSGAGFLFIPLLAIYAAWVIYTLSRRPPGAFLPQLGALAKGAADEARKLQSTPPKHKP